MIIFKPRILIHVVLIDRSRYLLLVPKKKQRDSPSHPSQYDTPNFPKRRRKRKPACKKQLHPQVHRNNFSRSSLNLQQQKTEKKERNADYRESGRDMKQVCRGEILQLTRLTIRAFHKPRPKLCNHNIRES